LPPLLRCAAKSFAASRFVTPCLAFSRRPNFCGFHPRRYRHFDDPIVRAAAVEGLGRYNGAVVAVDPNTGRILTVVNQKIAFGSGYIPCSTIKPTSPSPPWKKCHHSRLPMLKVGRRKYNEFDRSDGSFQ